MSVRVFREKNIAGGFTGRIQQFCSDSCAEEYDCNGLACERYFSEWQDAPTNNMARCDACLKWLQPLPSDDDRVIVNVRFVSHLRRDIGDANDGSALAGEAERMARQINDEIATAYALLKKDPSDALQTPGRMWKVTDFHLPGTVEFEEQIRQLEALENK